MKNQGPDVPPFLYKYRSVNRDHLRMISDGEIYFSSPKDLNDPVDCRREILYPKMTPNEIKEKLRDQYPEQRKLDDLASNLFISQYDQSYRQVIHGLNIDRTFKIYGVFSLSDGVHNPKLWEQYSDKHQGFCVGFHSSLLNRCVENLLLQYNSGALFEKVGYSDDRTPIDRDKINNFGVFILKFYSKTTEWSREEEWRFVSYPFVNDSFQDTRTFLVPIYCIESVTLGYRCNDYDTKKIIDSLGTSEGHSIKLYKMNPPDGEIMSRTPLTY